MTLFLTRPRPTHALLLLSALLFPSSPSLAQTAPAQAPGGMSVNTGPRA